MFNYEHAVNVAGELNRLGVRAITGDLIVTDNFSMNYSMQAQGSGNSLLATMESAKRSAAATRAWNGYLTASKKAINSVPSVAINGGVYVQALPTNAKLLFSHESAPMREILKVTLCYSK
jgi:D-alanyl-D-alanine carboxypeptidase/D-alanyl-D-alanine-endopeptidase (penicillin-binding protein 4)